jgi:type III pantothenate kinase
VDFGTATTFDCITASGVFVGGVITPGLYTTAESLVRRTAVLPRVELKPPPHVIGRRTDTAIRSGIIYGAIDAVDGCHWIRPNGGPAPGRGHRESPNLGPCATIDRVEPFMTLYGLMFALT